MRSWWKKAISWRGRILNDKSVYNTLENSEGRMVPLKSGDCVAGVLGHRNALHGYEGRLLRGS